MTTIDPSFAGTTSQTTPVFPSDDSLASALKRAYLLLEHGELKLARASIASTCSRHPEEPLPHALSGAVEIAAGDLDNALKVLRPVSRKWPEHPAAQLYLAEAFLLSRKIGQARRKISAVQRHLSNLEPGHPDTVWGEMADRLAELCEHIEAEQIPEPLRSHDDDEPSASMRS